MQTRMIAASAALAALMMAAPVAMAEEPAAEATPAVEATPAAEPAAEAPEAQDRPAEGREERMQGHQDRVRAIIERRRAEKLPRGETTGERPTPEDRQREHVERIQEILEGQGSIPRSDADRLLGQAQLQDALEAKALEAGRVLTLDERIAVLRDMPEIAPARAPARRPIPRPAPDAAPTEPSPLARTMATRRAEWLAFLASELASDPAADVRLSAALEKFKASREASEDADGQRALAELEQRLLRNALVAARLREQWDPARFRILAGKLELFRAAGGDLPSESLTEAEAAALDAAITQARAKRAAPADGAADDMTPREMEALLLAELAPAELLALARSLDAPAPGAPSNPTPQEPTP